MSPLRYAFGLIFLLIPFLGFSTVIHVPGDYPSIQASIDAASDGDTILIADGTYSGPGNIGIEWDATSKHLVIMSENGWDHCIIDCMEEGRAFLLNNGQDQRDVIEGLTITNGWVFGSGGAIFVYSTSPSILNCNLVNNTSYSPQSDLYYGGGALAVYDTAAPIIKGNILRNNTSSLAGGAIRYNKFASGVLENNIIDGNFSGEKGGGGIALEHFSDPKIINNLIINNISDSRFDGGFGGGIAASHSGAMIINNTIAFNSTGNKTYGGHGGGIAVTKWKPFPVIRNCIIWYNESGPTSMNIQFDPRSWMDISYCNVEEDLGHIFDLKPHTNIDAIPGFVDSQKTNFQLVWNSPCIDKGIPDTSGLYLPKVDLSGNKRIFESAVDIGAYEFSSPLTTSDLVQDRNFIIYPNPSSGFYFLENIAENSPVDMLLRIYNAGGVLVLEESAESALSAIPIDINKQPEGIYFLQVISGDRFLFRQKLVKE